MTFPGGNILNLALTVQGVQTVKWFKFASRDTNSQGLDVATYDPPGGTDVTGSFQPKDAAWAMRRGYDIQKTYATFYSSHDLEPFDRDTSGDQFLFPTPTGDRWQAVDNDHNWIVQDGWVAVELVKIKTNV